MHSHPAWTCAAFVILVLPCAYWLPAAGSAILLAGLVAYRVLLGLFCAAWALL